MPPYNEPPSVPVDMKWKDHNLNSEQKVSAPPAESSLYTPNIRFMYTVVRSHLPRLSQTTGAVFSFRASRNG